MEVSDFDSNGLIFLLNLKAVFPGVNTGDEDQKLYNKAVKNVLDAQRFSCIPLVNKPRIRLGTNDLKKRATYREGGGEVTHFARKAMQWEKLDSDDEILLFTREEVPHIEDEASNIMEAVAKMFTKGSDGRFPLMMTVGGTPKHPTAMFSEHEFLSERTKLELYRQFSVYVSENPDEKNERFINGFYRKLDNEIFHSCTKEQFNDLAGKLSTLSDSVLKSKVKLGRVLQRGSGGLEDLKFGRLCVGDIMQHACVGIHWDHTLKSNEQPKENKLAQRLLSVANDFTYLAVFNRENQLQPAILKKNSQESRPHRFIETSTSLEDLFSDSKRGDVFLIKPNEKLLTAEGPMKWPAIITLDEMRSKIAGLNYFVLLSALELRLRQVVSELTLHKIWEQDQATKKAMEQTWDKNATLGAILWVLRKDKSNLGKVCRRLGVTEGNDQKKFQQALEKARVFRNQLGHGAFGAFFEDKPVLDSIGFEEIKSLYWLKKVVQI